MAPVLPSFIRAVVFWLSVIALGGVFILMSLTLFGSNELLFFVSENHVFDFDDAWGVTYIISLFSIYYSVLTIPAIYILFRCLPRLADPIDRWLSAGILVSVVFFLPLIIFVNGDFLGIWESESTRFALLYFPAAWLAGAGLYHPWLNQPTTPSSISRPLP